MSKTTAALGKAALSLEAEREHHHHVAKLSESLIVEWRMVARREIGSERIDLEQSLASFAALYDAEVKRYQTDLGSIKTRGERDRRMRL